MHQWTMVLILGVEIHASAVNGGSLSDDKFAVGSKLLCIEVPLSSTAHGAPCI